MENHVYKMMLGGRELIVESGKYCGQADGSCIVRCGDTAVMVNATMADAPREGIDFFPLSVEFEEKIHHLADQMIAIDLDDGVKVNYAKFQDVLEKIK